MNEQATKSVRAQGTSERLQAIRAEVETAVLLADDSVYPAGALGGVLTVVAGLPLLVRAVLTLQRAGLQRVKILIGDDEQACRMALRRKPAISISVEWMLAREFRPEDVRTWHAVAAECGSFLLINTRLLFSAELIAFVRQEVTADDMLALSAEPQGAMDDAAERGSPSNVHVLWVPASASNFRQTGADPAARSTNVNPTAQRAFASTMKAFGCLLAEGIAAGRARHIALSPERCYLIRDQADISRAERWLLRSLKTDFEGIVDTYLNRPLSRRLSRLFLRVGVSPNTITVISVMMGLLAAAIIARGSYVSGVVGALWFQLSSVVDCCDGEVARVTFSESRFGTLLDLIGDNLAHLAIFGGVAWSVYSQGTGVAWMPPALPLALGAAAMLANGLSLWLVMRAKRLRDAGRFRSVDGADRVNLVLSKVASRDFSIVLIVFAAFGWLEPFLWLAALGSNMFWMTLAWITRPSVLTAPVSVSLSARAAREPRA